MPLNPIDARQAILGGLAISPDYPNVYYLGNKSARWTFLSQQHRAFNLIWALHDQLPGTRIAIIGGGLSGMTAAVAAQQAGAHVTLFERKADLLHLQRGCQLRFIHPNIYDWPGANSEDPFTDLPCLNWGAEMAARVVETLLRQWEQVKGRIEILSNQNVQSIQYSGDSKPIIIAVGAKHSHQGYDNVIVAVGFGLEKSLSSVPFISYWENDNLSRPVIIGSIPKHYLVSGCGDGGLIDATRLKIKDFDHARFVNELLSDSALQALKERLPAIDQEAAVISRKPSVTAQINAKLNQLKKQGIDEGSIEFDRAKVKIIEDFQSVYIYQQYEALSIPNHVATGLQQRLRSDTEVCLNSPQPTPMSLRASILNRFAIFLLRRFGDLDYRPGRLSVAPSAAGKPFNVSFQRDGFADDQLEVDEVVIRHGSHSVIERIFPKPIPDVAHTISNDIDELTRNPQYPPDFLSNPSWANLKSKARLEFATANLPRASEELFLTEFVERFAIELHKGQPRYVVSYAEAYPDVERQMFQSIPVLHEKPRKSKMPRHDPQTDRIFCGVPIFGAANDGSMNVRQGHGASGTLGCFVKTSSGSNALFTSSLALSHALDARIGDRVARGFRDATSSLQIIGEVTQLVLPIVSPEGATLSADTARFNKIEGAIAVLETDDFAPEYESKYKDLPKLRGVKSPETTMRVFKVGAGSELTWGTVTLIGARVRFGLSIPGSGWWEGLIAVAGQKGGRFSKPGDTGAVVVTADGYLLGHVVGNDLSLTYVCPAEPVFRKLNCELITAL